MSGDERRTTAQVRRSRWPGWIWAVPLAALGIVAWLAARSILHDGPTITISFQTGDGLKAEQTPVRFRGVEVGTIQTVELSENGRRVIATAEMQAMAEDLLRSGTRFWLAGRQMGLDDLSHIRAFVSGPYVAMEPGPGDPAERFTALPAPPPVPLDAKGKRYTLTAPHLGTVSAGTPIVYRGERVGTVENTKLQDDGNRFQITAFVRGPHDKLVRTRSRFWRVSAFRVSVGPEGLKADLSAPAALVSGMIAFDAPADGPAADLAEAGSRFRLHENEATAQAETTHEGQLFVVHFNGAVGDLALGAPVKLQGFVVGQVASKQLRYDVERGVLETSVTVELEPARFGIGAQLPPDVEPASGLNQALKSLVDSGLRAQLSREPPFIGRLTVSLGFYAPAGTVGGSGPGPLASIPAAPSSDLTSLKDSAAAAIADIRGMDLPAIAAKVRETAEKLANAASSPELESSLANLDRALADAARLTHSMRGEVAPTLVRLRAAAEAAESAAQAANHLLGGTPAARGRSLPGALQEITAMARSIRLLAKFLERNPEALLQGRDR